MLSSFQFLVFLFSSGKQRSHSNWANKHQIRPTYYPASCLRPNYPWPQFHHMSKWDCGDWWSTTSKDYYINLITCLIDCLSSVWFPDISSLCLKRSDSLFSLYWTFGYNWVVQVVAPFVCPATPVTAACLSQGRFVNSTQDATIKDLSRGAGSVLTGTMFWVDAFVNFLLRYYVWQCV